MLGHSTTLAMQTGPEAVDPIQTVGIPHLPCQAAVIQSILTWVRWFGGGT